MRALVFVTFTDCENKVKSLEAAGYEVHQFQYDKLPHEQHHKLIEEVRRLSPDFSVLIGAIEGPNHFVPRPNILQEIRALVPFIHMCNDAADPPWWPFLDMYNREGCFDAQVAIDGMGGPIASYKNGLVLLTPIDHRPFKPVEWQYRKHKVGMMGNSPGHGQRGAIVNGLIQRGLVNFHHGWLDIRPYSEYANFLSDCKCVLNHPMTGSGQYKHVKGRVIETGFARSCLLEPIGSPAANWFVPGVDYLEYEDNVNAAADVILTTSEDRMWECAQCLNVSVAERHNPFVFWKKVLNKVGVNC